MFILAHKIIYIFNKNNFDCEQHYFISNNRIQAVYAEQYNIYYNLCNTISITTKHFLKLPNAFN